MSLLDGLVGPLVADVFKDDMVGTTCVFAHVANEYDEVNDSTSGSPWSDSINCSPPFSYLSSEIDGKTILKDDMKLLVAGDDWRELTEGAPEAPNVGMTVTVAGSTFSIEDVGSVYTGGVIVLYTLHLRR